MQSLWTLGNKIYRIHVGREAHRLVVFLARGLLHHGKLKRLDAFFQSDPALQRIAEVYPYVYEQPTRAFFYKGSTFDERTALLKQHMQLLLEKLPTETVIGIYDHQAPVLWQQDFDGEPLTLQLSFHAGQRKEGLLSTVLMWRGEAIYQMIFWLQRDAAGAPCAYIGAMQGPNMADSREVIKRLTKLCFGYRTKNLILYVTQAVLRALGIQHIYAVTNEGYYANNHVRRDRKLKTSFSDFWLEAGGKKTADSRFDELPLTEPRKTIEEVKSQKRNLYRKRYALLDSIDAAIAESMQTVMRK